MKAISVRQPYAHMIVTGIKRFEGRSWWSGYHGWLAIHAAKTRVRNLEPELKQQYVGQVLDAGSIIGLVFQIDCYGISETRRRFGKQPYLKGPTCHHYVDAIQIAPIPVNGKLRHWTVPRHIAAQVFQQVPETIQQAIKDNRRCR